MGCEPIGTILQNYTECITPCNTETNYDCLTPRVQRKAKIQFETPRVQGKAKIDCQTPRVQGKAKIHIIKFGASGKFHLPCVEFGCW